MSNPTLLNWFNAQCQRQGIKVRARLMESGRALVPMTIGWLKPIVIVPTSVLTGLSENELKAIIIHEIAHVRRWDYLVNLFQTVFEIVMFFHPAVWWLSKQIRAERENCCDDVAVSLSGKPKTYANALTRVASACSDELRLAPSAVGGELLPRVRRILTDNGTSQRKDESSNKKTRSNRFRFTRNHSSQSVGGFLSLLFVVIVICGICVTTSLLGNRSQVFASGNSNADEIRNSDTFEVQSASRKNNNSEPDTNDDLVVRGLNVSAFPANTKLEKIPDLYIEDENKKGEFIWSGEGWSIKIQGDIWLKWRVDRNRFYIHDQSNSQSIHYGPIPGDPFEKLKLTEWMIKAINTAEHPQKSHFQTRTRRMLRSPHSSLNLNGLKITSKIKQLSYDDLNDFQAYLKELDARVIDSKSETLDHLLRKAASNLNRLSDEFNAILAVIKKEECSKSRAATEFELNKLPWGKETNGLRMAIGPWDEETKNFRTSIKISPGYRGKYRTLIRNVSKEPIIIGIIRTKERPMIYATDIKSGARTEADRIMIGGGVFSSNVWIKPGEVADAQTFALDFFDVEKVKDEEAEKLRWWDRINLTTGHRYKLYATTHLPQKYSRTKDGRWLPAKNTWKGNLTSGPISVEFNGEPDADDEPKLKFLSAEDDKNKNRIVDENGNGIPNANIQITEYSYKKNYKVFGNTTSDANGYFTYPPNTPEKQNFFFRVSAKGYFAERWIGNHTVHVKREGKIVPDILKLGKSVTISGKVIGPGNKPLAGIPLSIDYKNESVASINARKIVTDKNGEFKALDLPPGKIFVRYEWNEHRKDPMPRPVTFGIAYANAKDGESINGMNLDFSKKLASIKGRVLNLDGTPMKNVEVVARWAEVLVNLDHTVRSKTDADGNYEFKGLQPGTYLLGGGRRFPTASSKPVVVMTGQTLDFNIESFARGKKPPKDRKVELNWSKGDLQYALQLEPAKKAYQLRDRIKANLLVRNSTKSTIDFQHTFSFNRLHIGNATGFYRKLDYKFFTGFPRTDKYKLEPGHELNLGAFDIQITHPKDTGSAGATFGVDLKPDRYKFSVSIGNGFDSARLDAFPADKKLLDGKSPYTPTAELTVKEHEPRKKTDAK